MVLKNQCFSQLFNYDSVSTHYLGDSMRNKIIGLCLFFVLCGTVYLKQDWISEKWDNFYYNNIHTAHHEKINYKRRASYADMDKATRRPSFKSLVTEHYLSQSTATADRLQYHSDKYYSCLYGAWLYIEGTEYHPTERIKPKVYEVLCIPEEADLYIAYDEKIRRENPDWDEQKLKAQLLHYLDVFRCLGFVATYARQVFLGISRSCDV